VQAHPALDLADQAMDPVRAINLKQLYIAITMEIVIWRIFSLRWF